VSEVWIYLDESGTVDFEATASNSPYFAFGSATVKRDHSELMGAYVRARASRSEIENGFHAYNDSTGAKEALFSAMDGLRIRYAATFMAKANAFSRVRVRPKIWLYKYTLFRHLQTIIPAVSKPGDDVHVVAAHINMDAKREAVSYAVKDVCNQLAYDREVTPHIWKAPTSAGLQVADYALWATQRHVVQLKPSHHYTRVVEPRQKFLAFPWGK
jgi:hypothetical protein